MHNPLQKGKANEASNHVSSSEGEDDVITENDTESKTGRTREIFSRKGVHKSWSAKEQTKSSNV